MTVYSFYIFDRHTECIYSRHWLPPSQAAAASAAAASDRPLSGAGPPTNGSTPGDGDQSGAAVQPPPSRRRGGPGGGAPRNSAADDAKLIFGTVFSLRNIVRKLGGSDDAFISYRTAQYKLHYYETPSSLRFVMLTDTATLSMRNVLHQIYINLWVEYVVKNPLAPVEHKGGEGVKNELFELGLDQFVRGLM